MPCAASRIRVILIPHYEVTKLPIEKAIEELARLVNEHGHDEQGVALSISGKPVLELDEVTLITQEATAMAVSLRNDSRGG